MHKLMEGRVRGHHVVGGLWLPSISDVHNLIMREWGAIAGRSLMGDATYRLANMLIEFANVASPGDTVPVPAFDRDPASGILYYDGLASSLNADYLRVPIIATTIDSTDVTLYPNGNIFTYFAQTQGTVGIHGKPFSDVHNSVVYGMALVASPVTADPTRDLVFARSYFDLSSQIPKLATGQVGIEWSETLG